MTDIPILSASTRLYLRPIWFVPAPYGLEGQVARLANGLSWFQGYELRFFEGATKVAQCNIPIAEFESLIATFPDTIAERAVRMAAAISVARKPLELGERTIRFDVPQVMGILNVTPDSFSDGGKHLGDTEAAVDSGFAMSAMGASLIDVGGESTRPKAEKVWEGDEIRRIVPVIERLALAGVPVSVDTRKASVMQAALSSGAKIINDVSALQYDPLSLEVVANAGCPVMLMHSPSSGDDPHDNPHGYGDVVADVYDYLEARLNACISAGIARDKIVIDPGLGFGKSLADNLAIINRLGTFLTLGVPMLFAGSRKRIIGALSNEAPANERLGGSVALAFKAVDQGAEMVRAHDVKDTVQALQLWRGLADAGLSAF